MDKMNILYCFDNKSWRMAAVSMESLLLSQNPTIPMTIYCMVMPGTKHRGKFKKIVKSHKTGAVLVWREIKQNENPFGGIEYSKWEPTRFYRCIAHRFFKDVDKMLYLNNNTLVFRDLFYGLFNTDISDYAFAAVQDMSPINDDTSSNGKYVKEFSAKYLNGGIYYNAGVLLLNLKKMAESEHSFFEQDVTFVYPTQDLLNVAFAGKIKTLPLKYNLAPGVGVPSHFSQEDIAEVSAGKHVILDCYYARAYDKAHSNKLAYEMFEKCAKNIGMTPKIFLDADKKLIPVKKTFIPFVKLRGETILFFGMEIPKM